MTTKLKLDVNHCIWSKQPSLGPEFYYINHKTNPSYSRNAAQLLSKMGQTYERIQSIIENDVYIPKDLLIKSEVKTHKSGSTTSLNEHKYEGCKYHTNENITISINTMKKANKHVFINGICTLDITTTELYHTMSHLLAIYNAVNSLSAVSQYAVIMEDNVNIPYEIDYEALAASAPTDFGILQLYTGMGVCYYNNLCYHILPLYVLICSYSQI